MGWIKLDDGFLDHPKYLEAGPLASYLCIAGIAWSNRNRTDGRIPYRQVRRLVDFEGFAHHMRMGEMAGVGEDAEAMALAQDLVEVGLWVRDGRDFRIHDYHDWQQSREQIEAATDQRREAGKRGGRARWDSDSSNASPSVPSNGSSSGALSEPSSEIDGGIDSKAMAEVRSKKEEVEVKATALSAVADPEISQVFDEWVHATDRAVNATKLTADRRLIIAKALKSHGVDDCLAAVRNIGVDRWARGENDRHKRFDDIKHAIGSAERIERWREGPTAGPADEKADRAQAGREAIGRLRDSGRLAEIFGGAA